ncbi:two-component system response regulator CreB [Zhengella mangrovi]|uniref:Two-component system response regulator CreB n=2 Tax=Zhengella mangrovi TaxID=1982044 RepID=A0A2G1QSX7_9HYPH|nr:response regulator transcription factor [Zhengella mangrovi]PHP68592.1 two-component system response regulator CreB [Zhengella mangrovi]
MSAMILVADDDPQIRDVIRFTLEKAGMTVAEAGDGAQALVRFAETTPDLVVLDVGMPELDGLDVCREIRRHSETPVLFLSARDEEVDRILGLEMGGDDYVTKPFSPRELVARVKAILKRARGVSPVPADTVLAHGRLALDPESREALFDGRVLDLTALEFNMLLLFLKRSRRVFTREQIMQAAYDGNIHVSDRTIDSHIRNIRAKLASAGCPGVIETVHGVGFRLGACVPA